MKCIFLPIAALAALAIAGCGGPYTLQPGEVDQAELGARDYAERAGNSFGGCSGQDSDRDGYVTCTSRTEAGAAEEIVCSYKARGCKRKV